MIIDKEKRIARAVAFFKDGYNCAQSVTAAFADLYGFTEEQAFKMAASFGGGIGRMRQTCGAACGMFLLAGLESGATDGADRSGKSRNYAIVQELARRFEHESGSLICAELLGLKPKTPIVKRVLLSIMPNVRVPGWWKQQLVCLPIFWRNKVKVKYKKISLLFLHVIKKVYFCSDI